MIKTNCLRVQFWQTHSDIVSPGTKKSMNNKKICKFGATEYPAGPPTVWYLWLHPLCCCYRDLKVHTHTSKREIMTPLQPHLHLNADVCLQDAACHLYYCSQPIRVWVFGSVASKEERAPVHWINGVNNSLWRFSDYAQTESPHSTGRQTKTAQSKTSTQRQTSTLLKTSPQTLVNPACSSKTP